MSNNTISNNMNHARVSDLLLEIQDNKDGQEKITVSYLIKKLEHRSFAMMLLIFCLIPAMPLPSQGIATILSIPVIIIAFQMILAKQQVWLPKIISNKSIAMARLSKIIDVAIPYVKKFEKISKPRLIKLQNKKFERILGIIILLCAISMAIPVPFSNTIPSIAILFIALGLIEKDGLAIIAGIMISIVGIIVTISIIWGSIEIFHRRRRQAMVRGARAAEAGNLGRNVCGRSQACDVRLLRVDCGVARVVYERDRPVGQHPHVRRGCRARTLTLLRRLRTSGCRCTSTRN
ncbi:MAG: exopolysaccharide biosynthesis protein, partial [Pseudomonadota bacterium]